MVIGVSKYFRLIEDVIDGWDDKVLVAGTRLELTTIANKVDRSNIYRRADNIVVALRPLLLRPENKADVLDALLSGDW